MAGVRYVIKALGACAWAQAWDCMAERDFLSLSSTKHVTMMHVCSYCCKQCFMNGLLSTLTRGAASGR